VREEEVLEAARAIRPHIHELMGEHAASAERELDRLLAEADQGRDVALDLVRFFAASEPTRRWAKQLLDVPPALRSYASLPGPLQHVTVPSYRCPEQHGEIWYRFSVGEPVPFCPEHGVELERVS